VVCSDDKGVLKEGRGKPAPDIFLAAARLLGMDVGINEEATEGEETIRANGLVFEDAVPGVIAAKRAGMKVVWVPDKQLLAVGQQDPPSVDEMLVSLQDFVPERWGLPPVDD